MTAPADRAHPFAWPRLGGLWPRLGGLLCGSVLSLLLLSALAPQAHAQRFSYGSQTGGPSQAVTVGYHTIDFSYNGDDDDPIIIFDYDDVAYGVVYTRPNMMASIAYGVQQQPPRSPNDRTERSILDVALVTHGGLRLPGLHTEQVALYVPIALHTAHRRVKQDDGETAGGAFDEFNFTAIGLGAGLGVRATLSKQARFSARATPSIGFASRAFGDAFGSARMLDVDVQLHLGALVQRVGLTAGYTYRAQVWNIRSSSLFPNINSELFDYRGRQGVIYLGLNW